MFLRLTFILLVATLQVVNVAVSANDERNVDQWMESCNCENEEGISEHMELLSQAEECMKSLHQLNQSHIKSAVEWRREKFDLSLKLQNNEQELTKLQQKLHDQFIKYEAVLEESRISINNKILYENITAICNAIHDAKDQELHNAAMNGNVQLVRNLITKGVNVSATNEDRNSGLIFASWNNHTAIVKLLIEAGAYLNAQNINNSTALILAAYHNQTEVCKMLLDAGADANIENRHGEVALTYAVWRNNVEAVKMVLENGAEVDIATNEGNTPLHTAARYGYIDIAKILVEHGAKLNVKNNEGRTPLGRALFYHQSQMVRYLSSIEAKG
ncbi:hypothetical protein B566_EDAN014630 [Ephemera danica]|nr:hypothetical protein B566_EDAN014630 [Ephemera danica]